MNLFHLNTLGLPSKAVHFIYYEQRDTLAQLNQVAHWRELPRYVLGGGSNLVLPDVVEGLVIQVGLKGKSLLREDQDSWYVRARAGENWHDFVLWTLAQGFHGLENLALIPGTVGAAPVQNIGAYGIEIKDYLDHLIAYDFNIHRETVFRASDCAFTYRGSLFKTTHHNRFLITEVVLRLPKVPTLRIDYPDLEAELASMQTPLTSAAIAQAVMRIRKRKLPDPALLSNAGSFFKNPVVSHPHANKLLQQFPDLACYPQPQGKFKLAAGWLIEHAGWKGQKLGPVGMYEKQALVLVNYGGANIDDVKALCAAVQYDVHHQFGITLEPEPVFW